jgi:hypothetical protein
MHSVLILVERPKPMTETLQGDWIDLLSHAQGVEQNNPNCKATTEGFWQIVLDEKLSGSGMKALFQLGEILDRCPFPYHTLFFDEKPKWITTQPNRSS